MKEYTVAELSKYNGLGGEEKILVAVNGNVYDVTERGKPFYGQGRPYAMLAGKDASLALATMKTDVKDTGKPDDLSKLTELQKQCLASWEGTFKAKYTLVGKLVP